MMEGRGVEVLYFEGLLAEALEDVTVRADLLSRVFTAEQCGPRVAEQLTAALAPVPVEELVYRPRRMSGRRPHCSIPWTRPRA